MRLVALGLAFVLAGSSVAEAQHEGEHQGTFEEALAHRSGQDLRDWMERHRWSLGDRIAEFLEELLAARQAGEKTAVEKHETGAGFLAETIAHDPFSGWAVDVLLWDTEACARQDTAVETIRSLPAMIAAGEGDSAWAQIGEVRSAVVPEGGWPFLGPDLARCAAAYLHAGERVRARTLAAELASTAESFRRGVVLSACERILGELARLDGRIPDAAERTARAFEIRASLDSGPSASLLESIEGFDACDIDTLIELAAVEKESLLVVVSEKGRIARALPIGQDALADRIRSFVGAPKFDITAAGGLFQTLFGTDAALLEGRIGIVADGVLAELPFEALVSNAECEDRPERFLGVSHAVVRLSRPPFGGPAVTKAPSATKRIWLMVQGKSSLFFFPPGTKDEVRSILDPSLDDIRKSATGCTHLFFYAEIRDVEGLRGWKLDAEFAVLAKSRLNGLSDAFHAAGVRDILGCLHATGTGEASLPTDVCARMALGKPLLEAIREVRSEGASNPASWMSWVVHRRS